MSQSWNLCLIIWSKIFFPGDLVEKHFCKGKLIDVGFLCALSNERPCFVSHLEAQTQPFSSICELILDQLTARHWERDLMSYTVVAVFINYICVSVLCCTGSKRYGEQLGRPASHVSDLPQALRLLLLSAYHPTEQFPEPPELFSPEGRNQGFYSPKNDLVFSMSREWNFCFQSNITWLVIYKKCNPVRADMRGSTVCVYPA